VARYSFNLHRSCRAAPAPVPVPPDAPAFRVESSRSLEESQVPVEVKVPVTFLYPVLGDVVSILIRRSIVLTKLSIINIENKLELLYYISS